MKKICYIRGISKGGSVVYEGSKTGKTYRFYYNNPCLIVGEEVDEKDVYELLQKVKREMGSCGCSGGGSKRETTYPMFALRNF